MADVKKIAGYNIKDETARNGVASAIKSLSVSGKVITYTKGDGTTGTITTQDTDTNTWRGIQNNLTSTSTSDSLSAYQGKLLNDRLKTVEGHFDSNGTVFQSTQSEKTYSFADSEGGKINVGSSTKPVYFSNGVPVECSSSGGGGTKYYKHNIQMQFSDGNGGYVFFSITDTTSTSYSASTIFTAFENLGITWGGTVASGYVNFNGSKGFICGINGGWGMFTMSCVPITGGTMYGCDVMSITELYDIVTPC